MPTDPRARVRLTTGAQRPNIIPNAIPDGSWSVRPFEFAVRTIVDYDPNFLQDRLVSEIFVNGRPAGVYSAMRIGDDMARYPSEVIDRFGPDLERNVVDEFMGLGYRKTVRELEVQVRALQEHINRPRWWQLRRKIAARSARQED